MGRGLHALGDDLQVQGTREGDPGLHDRGALLVINELVDKRLVYLQAVHGEALEVLERGVAGVEVADLDEDALGDLKVQALGVEPGLLQNPLHVPVDLPARPGAGRSRR